MSGGRTIELYYEFAVLRGGKTDVGDKKTAGNSPGGEPASASRREGDCVITYPKGVSGPTSGI